MIKRQYKSGWEIADVLITSFNSLRSLFESVLVGDLQRGSVISLKWYYWYDRLLSKQLLKRDFPAQSP